MLPNEEDLWAEATPIADHSASNPPSRPELSRQEIHRLKADRRLLEAALNQAGAKLDGDRVTCPFHDDQNPSGSIHKGEGDGAWLYTCHGCEWNSGKRSGDVFAVIQRAKDIDFEAALDRVVYTEAISAIIGFADRNKSKVADGWRYANADGSTALLVVRFSKGGGKEYRPFHRGPGGWAVGDPKGALPLYGLRKLLDAARVYVVEGEKCVEAARSLGLTATTSAHGAKSPGKTDWTPLAGREVVILPDNDKAGHEYAQEVGSILQRLDRPASVKIVELPDLAGSGDIADFVEAQTAKGTEKEAIGRAVNLLADQVDSVPEVRSPIGRERGMESAVPRQPAEPIFQVIPIGDFLAQDDEEIEWVVEGLLPGGGASILAAKPKVGKSTLVRTLILSVARGQLFLNRRTLRGTVVYLCHEDLPAEVRKSFRKLGLTHDDPVQVFCGVVDRDRAVRGLKELIERHAPVLVVVDTLGKFLPITNFDDYGEVNRAFASLLEVVRSDGSCHVLFLHHSPKAVRGGGDDVLGSTAFFGNVDTVINMVMESGRRYASAEQQRYGAHLGKTELLMEPETDRVVVADGPQATPDSSVRIRAEIRSSLQQGTKTTEEIKVLVGGKTESVLDVLTGMVESGEILGTGKGVRGDPKRYSLKPSPSPTSDSVSHSAPVEKPDRELKAVEGPRSSPIKEHRLERKSRATPTSETIKVTGQEIAEALRVDRAA